MKKLEKMLWEGIETNDLKKVALALNLGLGVDAKFKCNYTPLHWAVRKDNLEITKFLIASGANVNSKDLLDRLPLHFAVSVAIAELLISAGSDVNAKGYMGLSSLGWAVRRGNKEMQDLLKQHGATI